MTTRVLSLLDKEWSDALKNRYILFLVVLLPLIFVILPVVMLYIMRTIPIQDPAAEMADLPAGWLNPAWADFTVEEVLQAAMASQFTVFFLIVPLAIPMTIATYSVIGEKRERSLEPLLATPLTVFELMLGKSVAAAAPGVAVTWISGLLFAIVARFVVISDRVYVAVITPVWLLNLLLLTPLLTVLATCAGLMVSSRVNDPRMAEQLGMIVILPILALFFGQMTGVLMLSVPLVLLIAFILLAVDVAMLALAVSIFQRESILTRWK
jgi:ABC-2 type transport system permease protein